MEVDPEMLAREGLVKPKMISDRARGVVRIVKTWEKRFLGTSNRCAAAKAYMSAQELAEKLNMENTIRKELPNSNCFSWS